MCQKRGRALQSPKSRTFFYSIFVLDLKWIKWETTGPANGRLRQSQLQRDECGRS